MFPSGIVSGIEFEESSGWGKNPGAASGVVSAGCVTGNVYVEDFGKLELVNILREKFVFVFSLLSFCCMG